SSSAFRVSSEVRWIASRPKAAISTSLAMAPAMALGHDADLIDLDGPLLMKQDRPDGIDFTGSTMAWPRAALWGA
ncbi:MAG: hypothetical protein AAF862_10465, partial [Pseudomonadota bacterium]